MRDMSTDGAIDRPRSARPPRSEDRGLANIALGVLLVLALVATVMMVVSDNAVWTRIGTLAALWAAFIGAFLVARYRRQAVAEAARVRDLHTVYELQLEREISARREHELVVEKGLRESVRAETSESLLALRMEIAALREQLGQMGVTLPEDRFAVGSGAAAGELGAGTSLPSVPSERVEPRSRAPRSSDRRTSAFGSTPAGSTTASSTATSPTAASSTGTPAPSMPPTATSTASPTTSRSAASGDTPATSRSAASTSSTADSSSSSSAGSPSASSDGSAASSPGASRSVPPEAPAAGVGPDATPSTERTERLSPVAAERTHSADPARGHRRPAVRPAARTTEQSRTARDQEKSAPRRTPDSRPAPETRSTPDTRPTSETRSTREPRRSQTATPETPSTESTPASRHGEGSGLSVAELMARLGSGDAPSGGRRRRASDD